MADNTTANTTTTTLTLRRSPRNSNTSVSPPSNPLNLKTLDSTTMLQRTNLRRSPRLSSTQSLTQHSSTQPALQCKSPENGCLRAVSLRRSPRLSSTTSSRESKSEPLPLLLLTNGASDENDAVPVPLKVFDPKCLRRSPRLCLKSSPTAVDDSGNVCLRESDTRVFDEKCLRRSPRLSLCQVRVGNGKTNPRLIELCGSSSDEPPFKKIKTSLGEKCLRRSPRTSSITLLDEKCLRRSRRISSSLLENGRAKSTLSELPESLEKQLSKKIKTSLDEKCLRQSPRTSSITLLDEKCLRRSPRTSSSLGGAENGRVKSTLSELPESSEKQLSKKIKTSLDEKCLRRSPRTSPITLLDEKCLRMSPRTSSSLGGAENGIVKSTLSELPEPLEKQLSKKIKTSLDEKCLRRSPRTSPITLLDEKCLRMSPRTSSSSAGAENGIVKSTLSELPESLEKQLSKKIKTSLDEKCLRRSPRTSPITLLDEKCLRMSPRTSSSLGGAENGIVKSTLSELPESLEKQLSKKIKTSLDEKCLRRSPRTSSITLLAEKCLRRSPRTLSSLGGAENGRVKCTLSELPESLEKQLSKKISLKVFGEKRLRRSPRTMSSTAGSENIKMKSNLMELSDSSDKSHSKNSMITLGKSELKSALLDEKCLRRCSVTLSSGVVTENVDIKSCLLEFSDSSNKWPPKKIKTSASPENKKQSKYKSTSFFIGEPIPDDEARERWGWRYELKSQRSKGQSLTLNADDEDEIVLNVECHYTGAKIDKCIFNLGDCAYMKGEGQKHVGRILEFFKTTEGEDYFRVQWFFRAEDTVMKEEAAFHDKKRLFYSTLMNDNLLDCIVSKVNVIQITPRVGLKSKSIPPCDYYYDMEYNVEYSTFRTLLTDNSVESCDLLLPNCVETTLTTATTTFLENMPSVEPYKAELALLDLYSGCGGMSTGLCLGAKLSCIDLVTRWAVDFDRSACESLKLNHPETQVRNETAEDFLELLKGWEKLSKQYADNDVERTVQSRSGISRVAKSNVNSLHDVKIPTGEYEVSSLVDICYGDPNEAGKRGLKFKVHWRGHSPSEDTWEPIEGLSNCQEKIWDFVRNGLKSKILPLPGDVDVICGGPPCQGISGYNRYRNVDTPLADERNHQIVVFMDIVEFLKPKYVLMENVADLLRFDKASLGRYALSRLVHMNYQARLGTIAAGCYGLPQFRLRVFLWGAHPSEKLPQFPLPTHDVVVRYWPPPEFERNTVAYDEGQPRELEKAVVLCDAISDLPAVTSHEIREEMPYGKPPETEFQKYIRSTKYEMMGFTSSGITETDKFVLYDHRPYQLSEDNLLRTSQIPRRKGANFRDLPGVVVGTDNVARRDPTKEQMMLPSGKPMVPDYVFTFEQGKSKRPFARLWWDETMTTVVTFPNLRSMAALHPEQDRVLTIRECARLQGFPDYYRFCGTVKERYCQVGNAVAVSVARALGYALGMAFQKLNGNEPLLTLPPKFSLSNNLQLTKSVLRD